MSPNFVGSGKFECALKEHGNILINNRVVEVHFPSPKLLQSRFRVKV
jgi:hypothetical protein